MPRRDDVYYKAYPALFLTSSLRFELTRSQWGIYRDLIDLLRANGGEVSADPGYLSRVLLAEPSDLVAVLACKHVYTTRNADRNASNDAIRHAVVDEMLKDLDSARKWGAEMAAKRHKKSHERDSRKAKQNKADNNGQRDALRSATVQMGHTQTDSQSQSECAGAPKNAPRTAPLPAPLQGGPSATPEPIYPKRKTKIGPDGLLYFADEPEVPA